MFQEWVQSATVDASGKIEVILPTLEPGARVEVTVRSLDAKTPGSVGANQARAKDVLARMKLRGVEGANISDESLRRENICPDRT